MMLSIKFLLGRLCLIILIFLLTPFISPSAAVYATSIIIYIGKNEIIIGADSRNVTKGHDSDSLEYLESCKIRSIGGYFCAMSGFTNSISYNFDPYKIVEKHLIKNQQMVDVENQIISEVKENLEKILKLIRTNEERWKMVVTKENRILDIAIIGNSDGNLIVERIGFVLTNAENIQLSASKETIICNEKTNKYTAFGDVGECKNYIVANMKNDIPEKLIENAIIAQSKVTPVTVGGPVNILKVGKDSHQWLSNKTCKDQP